MRGQNRQDVVITSEAVALAQELFKQKIPEGFLVRLNPRAIIHYHSYGNITPFFRGLAEGKLLGARCAIFSCRDTGIWLPPRVHCPDCWSKMNWVEINTDEARVYSHSMTKFPGAGFKGSVPCPLISVTIPGVCTKMMSYLSKFGDGEPYIGMRIRPVFRTENPTYTILDLSWVPVE